jgi:quinol-cytochrome oxidoreductase complex cytochrome b subunit
MLGAIFILALLPFLDTSVVRSSFFKPMHLLSFVFFMCVALCLG